MRTACLPAFLWAPVPQEDDAIGKLIEKLRSEKIEERGDAERQLEAMGEKAEAQLEKGAKDQDPEVAQTAKRLLRLLPFQESLLGTFPKNTELKPLDAFFAPGGITAAFKWARGHRQFFVVGEKHGEEFDDVWSPTFSHDGKIVAYMAKRNGKNLVVVNGRKGNEFGSVEKPVFSPDDKLVAYGAARTAGHWCMVVNGKTTGDFFLIGELVFSPNGESVAFGAYKDVKGSVVVWRKPFDPAASIAKGEEFDSVSQPRFSPDGVTLAYVATQNGKRFVVMGEKKGAEFDTINDPVFDPLGRILAYRVLQSGKWFIVAGEKRGEDFDNVGKPVFSPDSKRVAYGARDGLNLWRKVIQVEQP